MFNAFYLDRFFLTSIYILYLNKQKTREKLNTSTIIVYFK